MSGYVADLDGDGYGEVIVDNTGSLLVLNYDGTVRWNTSYLSNCIFSYMLTTLIMMSIRNSLKW